MGVKTHERWNKTHTDDGNNISLGLDVIEKEGCIWTVKHRLLPYWLPKLQLLPVAAQMNPVICVFVKQIVMPCRIPATASCSAPPVHLDFLDSVLHVWPGPYQ